MYQAGVKNITLYENKTIRFRYYDLLDESLITDLTTLGAIIEIENLQRPTLDIESKFGKQGKMVHDYKISFNFLGLLTTNLNLLNQLAESIYGWCFLAEFYDGTFKFYNVPLFCRSNKINPHNEMSFSVELISAVSSSKAQLNYTAGVSLLPVYRWDSTILRFDSTIYTLDYDA